ncbi:MAG: helix-turn-helix domain-containing protein [Ilumatobacteraceae bacterium]
MLYVDNGSVLTGAGTAASIDLCLHLVRMDRGAEVANTIAREWWYLLTETVVRPSSPGAVVPANRATTTCAPRCLGRRPSRLRPVGRLLAKRAAMSPRTFARRFKDATGTTPLQWVLHQRAARAQHLPEVTDLPGGGGGAMRIRYLRHAAPALPPGARHHAGPTGRPSVEASWPSVS